MTLVGRLESLRAAELDFEGRQGCAAGFPEGPRHGSHQSEARRACIAEVVGSNTVRSTGIYVCLAITGLVIVIGTQAVGVILVISAQVAVA